MFCLKLCLKFNLDCRWCGQFCNNYSIVNRYETLVSLEYSDRHASRILVIHTPKTFQDNILTRVCLLLAQIETYRHLLDKLEAFVAITGTLFISISSF